MALNLAADALISSVSALTAPADTSSASPTAEPGVLAGSQALTGLEIRLSRLFIKDNHTARVGPFPGRANLYLLVVVTDGNALTANQVTLDKFPGIDDQQDLLVDRTLYFWEPGPGAEPAPRQLHVLLSVLKSKQRLRDTSALLTQAQASASYQGLAAKIGGKALAAAGEVPSLLLQLGSAIGSVLTDVEDKTLLTQVTSFTNLNGDFDKLGPTPHTQENQYVATTLTLVVRDAARMTAAPGS